MAYITDENNDLVHIPTHKEKKEITHLEPIIVNCRKYVDRPLREIFGNIIIKIGHIIKGG